MSAFSRQRAAFAAYLALGPGRSLKKLHDRIAQDPKTHRFTKAPSLRTLEQWSIDHGWSREVERLEREAQQEEAVQNLELVRAYRDRLRKEGLLLQQKGIAWLGAQDPKNVRTHEAIRAIAEGFRLEALGLGEVTERIAIEEDYHGTISRLSDDELLRLVALLGPAPGAGPARTGEPAS